MRYFTVASFLWIGIGIGIALAADTRLTLSALPAPSESKSKQSDVIGWPRSKTPIAPAGFKVTEYGKGLQGPRWVYVAPNKDVLVAESRSGRITLLRDSAQKGVPNLQTVYLGGVKQPFGMAVLGRFFYVAASDALWRYAYDPRLTRISGAGMKILDLPKGGRHWTRNLLARPDGTKIYVAVGSASNNAENGIAEETRRASILEINPDGSGEKIFASGIRNPVGMDWAPTTQALWTAVNERDELGDDLVPDYLAEVKAGGFYGWPYSYFGSHPDPRMRGERPDLVKIARVPEVSLGAHTASLGLAFYRGQRFPEKYRGGAFVGQHGSWNRSEFSGYKVVFVPFQDGKPSGPMEDFLTGFIVTPGKSQVYGRPVGVAELPNGGLLVADDAGDRLWLVSRSP